jgi:AbiV family abortive infection protein
MANKSSSSKPPAVLSSDNILVGVFLALRQAWELLSSATILQHAEKFSSAYGLAVFCREEVGKSRLLEKYWEDSRAGRRVSTRDLNSGKLMNHAEKLRAAGKVLSEGIFSCGPPPDPGSTEERELFVRLHQINATARELDPSRTHLGRLRAFYVEMHEAGAGWWRPWIIFDGARSSREISEAECAYLLRRCELDALKKNIRDVALRNRLYLPPELPPALT